jgi:hypothetical protein
MKRKDPVTRIEWLVVFRRHMKRSPRTNSLGNFWGTLIGMFSALYCADNIGPANRFLSLGQYAMTELGLPTWLAEILVFGAIVIPGMLLGGYVQNWGRRRFFDAQDTPSAFLVVSFRRKSPAKMARYRAPVAASRVPSV